MNTQSAQTTVTRELVPEDRRMAVVERLLGIHFPLRLEPVIYGITERMAVGYSGFYMAPSTDRLHHVSCNNMYQGGLSVDALGITACLYAYSHLSCSGGRLARVYACHYYRLREYMFEHPEVRATLGATD